MNKIGDNNTNALFSDPTVSDKSPSTVRELDGNDYLFGGFGSDYLYGSNGNDYIEDFSGAS